MWHIQNRMIEWTSERSPRFETLFSAREPFHLLLQLSCPPASTSSGEALPGGLLEGSCGRRKRRRMPNHRNVGMCPLITVVSKYENVLICVPMAAMSTVWPSGETGAGVLAFYCTRNAKGLREPERKGCFAPVEFYWSRRSCKRSA